MPQNSQRVITTGQLDPGDGWGLKLPGSFLATTPEAHQAGTYFQSSSVVIIPV